VVALFYLVCALSRGTRLLLEYQQALINRDNTRVASTRVQYEISTLDVVSYQSKYVGTGDW
jgi:hypothetical protein